MRIIHCVPQDVSGGGMQSDLWFLYPDQRWDFPVALQQGSEYGKGAQRTIGHVYRWESPSRFLAGDLLTKLECFKIAYRNPFDTFNPRCYFGQVTLNAMEIWRILSLQCCQNARQVLSVMVQEFTGVWRLRPTHYIGSQTVKRHVS